MNLNKTLIKLNLRYFNNYIQRSYLRKLTKYYGKFLDQTRVFI